MRRILFGFLLASLVTVASAQVGAGHVSESRIQQLQRGLLVYEQHCARCHDHSRTRRGVDQLAMRLGAKELAWHSTMQNLVHYVSTYMPFDRPATLTQSEYLDVIAFLLYRVELLPAGQMVTPETIDLIELPSYR